MEFLLLAALAGPVQQVGPCPLGYFSQAGYCIPAGSQREAITRVGDRCPYGWYSQGAYCLRAR